MRHAWIAALARLRALARDRRGNIAMMFGLTAIPMVIGIGVAVDATRAYTVKVRLGNALDAAALAVGSTFGDTPAQLQTRLQNYFTANYPASAIGQNISVSMSDPTQPVINVTATAQVPLTFMRLVPGLPPITVTVSNQITKGFSGLELALVLDNTGSMLCGDQELNNCPAGTPPDHMDLLVQAANSMVSTLYQNTADTSKLKIAVVPYVTTVNVAQAFGANLNTYIARDGNGHYIDIHGNPIKDINNNFITYDATQTENTGEWRGCVIEPTGNPQPPGVTAEDGGNSGPDFSEPVGGWGGLKWNAFYWPTNTKSPGQQGYNNWNAGNITYSHAEGTAVSGWDRSSRGPNNGCPTPMIRLTSTEATITNAIAGLKAWDAGGTQIHVGMIWGWRAISPNPPFSDGQPYQPNGPTPGGWLKVVVLETDGVNELPDPLHLTGLSMLGDGKFGSTNQNTALNNLNSRLTKICNNMKNAGIIIYTIGLGSQGSTNYVLQQCAGSNQAYANAGITGQFIPATDGAQLQSAFQTLAQQLLTLRLTK
jgi:Flp pilus assembly protein TadG